MGEKKVTAPPGAPSGNYPPLGGGRDIKAHDVPRWRDANERRARARVMRSRTYNEAGSRAHCSPRGARPVLYYTRS